MHAQSKSRMIFRMTLAELVDRITRLRLKRGLSERGMCLRAGIGVDRIRTMKRGHPPARWVLRKLADLLECEYDYLDDGSIDIRIADEPPPNPKRGRKSSGFAPKPRRSPPKNNPNLVVVPHTRRH